jgi:hypothetical protein
VLDLTPDRGTLDPIETASRDELTLADRAVTSW